MLNKFEFFLSTNTIVSKSIHPHYEKALNEMLKAGGKRFRPMLLLNVVKAYSPLLVKNAMSVAYAIELLHTYSLIHDDLPSMDNADLRRSMPTLHKTYDEVTAILVGDALNTYAFEVLSETSFSDSTKIKLIKSLSKNGGLNGMVLGQAIDCHFENTPLSVDDVKTLHKNKTAKLIASSLEMGAIISNEIDLSKKLYKFGLDLGLLFQIQDDILDVTQSSELAGKTTNNDGDKNSFINIIGLDDTIKEANELSEKIELEFNSFDQRLKDTLSPLITKYINRHKD